MIENREEALRNINAADQRIDRLEIVMKEISALINETPVQSITIEPLSKALVQLQRALAGFHQDRRSAVTIASAHGVRPYDVMRRPDPRVCR